MVNKLPRIWHETIGKWLTIVGTVLIVTSIGYISYFQLTDGKEQMIPLIGLVIVVAGLLMCAIPCDNYPPYNRKGDEQ